MLQNKYQGTFRFCTHQLFVGECLEGIPNNKTECSLRRRLMVIVIAILPSVGSPSSLPSFALCAESVNDSANTQKTPIIPKATCCSFHNPMSPIRLSAVVTRFCACCAPCHDSQSRNSQEASRPNFSKIMPGTFIVNITGKLGLEVRYRDWLRVVRARVYVHTIPSRRDALPYMWR